MMRRKGMGTSGAILKHPDGFYPLMKLKMAATHAKKQIPCSMHLKSSRSFGLSIQQLGRQIAKGMGAVGDNLKHLDDFYPLVKLKMAKRHAEKQIPPQPHWGFCYTMLLKICRSFGLLIRQLRPEICDAACVLYLILRALDTVEDDTTIPTEVKVPILIAFHRHIYDRNWKFSCGTKHCKVLMDEFHHVSTAFLELEIRYQEVIEDTTMRIGAGMAKFISKGEVETMDDYEEYCHYAAAIWGLGLSKLFHASGLEDLAPDSLSKSWGLFLQKTNIIKDYLEDMNEIPKCRMFWPREIWSKYVTKLEDLKYEENSTKAVQCLNEMVIDALLHVEDCLEYMSTLRDLSIFRYVAIPKVMAMGTLVLCYNNVEVFRGPVNMRIGLAAKVFDQTKTMADVYGAFFDFSSILKSKVEDSDPNAKQTLRRIEAIQIACRESGTLLDKRCFYLLSYLLSSWQTERLVPESWVAVKKAYTQQKHAHVYIHTHGDSKF